jgi:hypothetical protein
VSVDAADLSTVTFVGANFNFTDTMNVRAFDGVSWSAWTSTSLSSNNTAPVVVASSANVTGTPLDVSSLMSITDADGDAITQYQFFEYTNGGGYLAVDGVQQSANNVVSVDAADLSTVTFVGADFNFSDTMNVRAFDGVSWSAWTSTTVTSNNTAPVVVASSANVTGTPLDVSSLMSITDADGDAITQYQFFEYTNGGGYLAVDGVQQSANNVVSVDAADLSTVTFVGANFNFTDTMNVRAFDGVSWSAWTSTSLSSNNTAPVVTAFDVSIFAGAEVKLGSLFSLSDSDNDAFTKFEFFEFTNGGGYVEVDDVLQGANQVVSVMADQLDTVNFVGGNSAVSDVLNVRAFDGLSWSDWEQATITTQVG